MGQGNRLGFPKKESGALQGRLRIFRKKTDAPPSSLGLPGKEARGPHLVMSSVSWAGSGG